MGLMGMVIGLATEVVGVIKDDKEMVLKGAKRCALGTATFVIGDVFGVSDVVGDVLINTDL